MPKEMDQSKEGRNIHSFDTEKAKEKVNTLEG